MQKNNTRKIVGNFFPPKLFNASIDDDDDCPYLSCIWGEGEGGCE